MKTKKLRKEQYIREGRKTGATVLLNGPEKYSSRNEKPDAERIHEMDIKTWICDSCGKIIQRIEDGWIEWLLTRIDDDGNRSGRGLRLVHHRSATHRSCRYDSQRELQRGGCVVSDLPFSEFLGPDGLMLLLSFLANDELPKSEVLEMIKRLHIPGYEHARHYFDQAISEGVFEPDMPEGYYWQTNIEAVLEFANREQVE